MSTATAHRPMRRREFHAATVRSATSLQAAKQMFMPFRHNGAVAKGFAFKPGFIYAKVRAISARINQNYDGWPSTELKKSYRTFIGKPIFVNHQNFDYKKARGKVVASRYVEAGDDKYIETVMEIDAKRFPRLAHEIKTGGLDSVSMGVEAGFTICSYCGNKAVDVPDFCAHVKYHKGERLPRINDRTGKKEDVLVYEKCYKLGFFELSWVFDPADETAMTSHVITAAEEDAPPPDEIVEGEMPYAMMPQASRRYHLGYGEVEAPEDVDTLRNEEDGSDDGTDEFKHYVESPKELRGPDLDQTKRLDRAQEQQGLDADRRVEDVEDIGGIPMAARTTRRAARRQSSPDVLVDTRTGRRYYAADEDDDKKRDDAPPPEDHDDDEGDFGGEDDGGDFDPDHDGDDDADPEGDTDDDFGGGDELDAGGAPPLGGDDMGTDPMGGAGPGVPPGKSDQDLIQEAEQDLMHADALGGDDFSMDPGSDAGGSMDDYSDPGMGSPAGPGLGADPGLDGDDSGHFDPDADGDDDSDPVLDFDRSHHPELGTHPAVQEAIEQLLGGGGGGAPPPPQHQGRRKGNQRGSSQKKRKGGPQMSLAKRGQMVASRQSRRHHADDNGYTDGGPYHTDDNDQGEKEDTFISETPGSESVAVPCPGDGTISNTENNLVARKLQRRIQQRRAQQRRDLIAYEQITGRRLRAEAVEDPDQVDPTVNTGPAAEELTGKDFEDVGLEDVETQPKDAARHSAFNAFDRWLYQATGRTARQHGNVKYIRRQAARWCSFNNVSPNALFPAMGYVLREAQKNEGANRRAAMKRQADESLEVAAPQDRIDVEAPVRDTTDAEAQASQFDLSDFGNNAGDDLADPELSVDTQIWAPGEGDSSVKKDSNRKADGITAVRYAEAYIRAGLGENTPEEKWKIAGLAMNMRHGTIMDRISVLDAVNSVTEKRYAALRRQANRGGAPRGLPQGLGQRQMTAGTQHEAANDIAMEDLSLWAGR